MPRTLYSYRLGREVPLLSDEEYRQVMTHLSDYTSAIMKYRTEHAVSLEEARINAPVATRALEGYKHLTGVELDHPDQLYAVRLSDYGRPCPVCTKPFRTPRARFCAECGYKLPEGEVAGPASLADED